eukprot:Sdes_comp15677_c0_seq1m4699
MNLSSIHQKSDISEICITSSDSEDSLSSPKNSPTHFCTSPSSASHPFPEAYFFHKRTRNIISPINHPTVQTLSPPLNSKGHSWTPPSSLSISSPFPCTHHQLSSGSCAVSKSRLKKSTCVESQPEIHLTSKSNTDI